MKTFVIAVNTFREAVRDRILYVLMVFAVVVIIGSKAIAWVSMGQEVRMLKDLGLASISFFSVIIAIFVGTQLIHKELDKRTIYTIASKPVARWEFVVGKYVGLLLTLLVNVAVMGGVFLGYVHLLGAGADLGLAKAVILIFGQVLIITAIAVFFSTITSPILGAVFTFCAYVVGCFSDGLALLATQFQVNATYATGSEVWLLSAGGALCRVAYFLVPNLGYFDQKLAAARGLPVPWSLFFVAFCYGIVYSAIVMGFAAVLFRRKNF